MRVFTITRVGFSRPDGFSYGFDPSWDESAYVRQNSFALLEWSSVRSLATDMAQQHGVRYALSINHGL